MDARTHFLTFARYNAWANARLYGACAALSQQDLHVPRDVFFGSIIGTLNHILVGDRMWTARLRGGDSGLRQLDAVLFDDFAQLRAAREQDDQALIDWVEDLAADDIDREIEYSSVTMGPQRSIVHEILTHLFNHQTHHRGQVHACLSGTAVTPPSIDLIYFLRV